MPISATIMLTAALLFFKSCKYSLFLDVKFLNSTVVKLYMGDCNSICKIGWTKDFILEIIEFCTIIDRPKSVFTNMHKAITSTSSLSLLLPIMIVPFNTRKVSWLIAVLNIC